MVQNQHQWVQRASLDICEVFKIRFKVIYGFIAVSLKLVIINHVYGWVIICSLFCLTNIWDIMTSNWVLSSNTYNIHEVFKIFLAALKCNQPPLMLLGNRKLLQNGICQLIAECFGKLEYVN